MEWLGRMVVKGEQGEKRRGSEYREFRAPGSLAEYVLCFWTQAIDSRAEFAQRVLPDCCVDVMLVNDVPTVVGPWTEPFLANLAPGTRILGARCHPGLASSLLGVPASELLNRSAPLSDVWGRADADAFARIAEEKTLEAKIFAMESALLSRVANAAAIDKSVTAAIEWIARRPEGQIEELSRWLGFSSRQIQRRFRKAVGYGPKLFQSVLRFQRLLSFGGDVNARGSLAQFAADACYADQSHMTREVQRFSGKAPSELLCSSRSTLALSRLIRPVGEFAQ